MNKRMQKKIEESKRIQEEIKNIKPVVVRAELVKYDPSKKNGKVVTLY